jgi:hypothetical protein
MNDGLGQLLLFLFFMAAAVFDAVGRGRARRRRMEEMERAEESAGEEEREGSEPAYASSERVADEAEVETPLRKAEVLIPDDLWAILTGGAPRPGAPVPTTEEAPALEAGLEDEVEGSEERLAQGWGDSLGAEAVPAPVWQPLFPVPAEAPRVPDRLPLPEPRIAPVLESPRGDRGSDYAQWLRSGNVRDLRAGVVLREVLGPPVALRPPGEVGWEDRS